MKLKYDSTCNPLKAIPLRIIARESRPVRAYIRWAEKIPNFYQEYVLHNQGSAEVPNIETDDNCLALLKHYHSLAPMSMEARKPIFLPKPADGAIGAHVKAVQSNYTDFEKLAKRMITLAV